MEGIPHEPQGEKIQYKEISDEILKMAEEDQAMRERAGRGGEWDPKIDIQNTSRLKEIVSEIGWPTVSKVGKWPSYNAWLIAQHAMHDIPFMREALELMRAEPEGEVDPANIAYLEDRLNVHDGLPQKYGTQYGPDRIRMPLQDPEHVDDFRASVGLVTLAEEEEDLRRFDKENPDDSAHE